MAISMYRASIPVCIRMLNNLSAILKKADRHAREKNIDPEVLAGYRLYPDMYPLTRQVQIACDVAKGCGARLSGVPVPKFPDNETSIRQLRARIDSTVKFLKQCKAWQIDGSEMKEIVLELPRMTLRFSGEEYLLGFVLPNLYFHVTTTYNILRHCGLDIGKGDFLGAPPARRGKRAARKPSGRNSTR